MNINTNTNRIFLALIFLILLSVSAPSQIDRCSPIEKKETTHWVGNLEMVFVEKRVFGRLQGLVVTPDGGLLKNALVEVFTKPEYLLIEKPVDKRGRSNQRRIAACRTGINGRFSFPNLPPGSYELRSSSDDTMTGWNVTQIYIVVNPRVRKKSDLRVNMSLGI